MNVISLLTPKAQVAYLYDDFTVRQGLEKLRAHGYTAIPVLARDGSYVGTVSEGDFLWNLVDRQDNSLRSKEKQPLKSVMRKSFNPPVSVGVSMEELLERSMRQSFIPVVDDRGAFVGIVTRQNIIQRNTLVTDTILVLRYHPLLKSSKGIPNHVHHGVADGRSCVGQELHAALHRTLAQPSTSPYCPPVSNRPCQGSSQTVPDSCCGKGHLPPCQ